VGDGEYAAERNLNYDAAARYLQARYGPGGVSAWLSPGETVAVARYARGGIIRGGLATARNTTGRGERVTSPDSYLVTPEEPEPAVVPGSVTGYRWWTLPAPDWKTWPGDAEANWPRARLHGVQGSWQPGVNTASCHPGYSEARQHQAPAKNCSCGFWAYWQPEYRGMGSYDTTVPVFGAIQAWGRARLATRGFRAEKARIMAVHLPFTLLPERASARIGWYDAFAPAAQPEFTLEEAQADADRIEAWIAVIGDRLERDYGVAVFETRDLLLKKFPPDPVRGSSPCRHCELPGGRHQELCPENAGWTARGGSGSVTTVHAPGGSGGSAVPGGGGGGGGSGSGLAQWNVVSFPGGSGGSGGGSGFTSPGGGSAGGSH
jgi:hypothetical protein